jgi:uncharacterized protein
MPRPAPGDLFFDMEGDPHVQGGLEYLFGIYFEEGKEAKFEAIWAHDRAAERNATRRVLEFFRGHVSGYPNAHIYHYGTYEVAALKRLSSSHGVGEAILDHLLREQRFVNLLQIVQGGMIASEPGYSLKDLEAFYMDKRADEVSTAMDSVIAYEEWRETNDPETLENIRQYNETDCRSTKGLRDWLIRDVRPAELPWFVTKGTSKEQSTDDSATLEAEADREELKARIDTVRERLGPDAADLIFELSWFHQREDKPQWWAMFERAEKESDELIDDLEAIGGLEAIAAAQPVKRSKTRRYRFPAQETKMRADTTVKLQDNLATVTLTSLDLETSEAEVKFGPSAGDPPDRLNLIPGGPIQNDVLRQAVRRVVEDMVAGKSRYRALEDLLYRKHPRLKGRVACHPILRDEADVLEGTAEALRSLDGSYMPIQGPPGTGKTYVSSLAILGLMRNGCRVGVSSNSHKAIDNLLKAVADRAREQGFGLRAIKKISPGREAPDDANVEAATSNEDDRLFAWPLVGGTAWLFARADHDQAFDYLFVDEAGQVSLANLIAMGTAAKNVVLVGDPMQLSQPIQAAHPGDTGLSALEYALCDHATVPPDRGIFLPITRRMHPAICQYISELVYEGRLHSDEGASKQKLSVQPGHPVLRPAALRFVEVMHEGNSQSSAEEADALAAIYQDLLGREFCDRDGIKRVVGPHEILVVSPYNAQVNLLGRTLPSAARVGTVDKFQGQEAPICLISMATSSGDDLPRNIEFLFSVNRLNVAISRAQAVSVVFASPKLLDVPCKSIDEMRLVNALCAVHHYSSTFSGDGQATQGHVS